MLNRLGLFKMDKNFMEKKDLGALSLLSDHLPDQYFAWTQKSIKPHSLLAVVNDMVVNQRKTIVEFGMGISTIVISNIIKKNNLETQLISFEHDENWIKIVNSYVSGGNQSYHLPLNDPPPFSYNADKTTEILKNISIDSVLVDGPPAYNWIRRRSRRSVIDIVKPFLNQEKFCIFLDDVNRPSEYKSVKLWSRDLGAETKIINNCLGCVIKGNHYKFI